jgi:Tfp pilus assembly protein PilF
MQRKKNMPFFKILMGSFLLILVTANIGCENLNSRAEILASNTKIMEHIKQKQYDLATAECDKVLAINFNSDANYNTYALKASVYVYKNDAQSALDEYNKAIAIKPNLPTAYIGRAYPYEMMKEYDKAWADVHTAESLGWKTNPEFINYLTKASGRNK